MTHFPGSDNRPPKDGWAAGGYFHRACSECGLEFIGDKRAITCAPCAYQDDKYDGFD